MAAAYGERGQRLHVHTKYSTFLTGLHNAWVERLEIHGRTSVTVDDMYSSVASIPLGGQRQLENEGSQLLVQHSHI